RQFYYLTHCGYESIHLLVFDYQRRSHFQHHEIVPAYLGQKTKIAEQSHHQNLSEHRAVDGAKRFVWNSQPKLLWSLEFNSHQQAHSANFLDHLEFLESRSELLP